MCKGCERVRASAGRADAGIGEAIAWLEQGALTGRAAAAERAIRSLKFARADLANVRESRAVVRERKKAAQAKPGGPSR